MVQSAIVRSSCIDKESEVSPTMSISPSIDDWGPRVGCPAVVGSCSPMEASFSETICRAR